jgi:methyltransferase (TIGR00027 family)
MTHPVPSIPPDRNTSRTALGTAYLRAAHQVLDAPPHILEDPLAVTLLGTSAGPRIRAGAEHYQTPERRGLRAHVVLRSRFAEDRLEESMERGVGQYVILGAGFDTFALRQLPWAKGLRILEVDQPATQEMKRAQIAEAGLVMPVNASFAAIDFERESLRDGLRRSSVSLETATFFSWLGVTMYLNEDAIDAVLHTVAAFPAGSEIVLTFSSPGGPPSLLAQRAATYGEPWISYLEPDEIEKKLRGAGFSKVEFLTASEAEARYFRDRPQDLPIPKRTGIVCARR